MDRFTSWGKGPVVAIALVLALLLPAAGAAAKRTIRITGHLHGAAVASFPLERLQHRRIVRATVVRGTKKRRVAATRLRKAKKRGSITVKVPKVIRPKPTDGPGPASPVLVVVTTPLPATPAPAVDPAPAADPAPAPAPAPGPAQPTVPVPSVPEVLATLGPPGGPILSDALAAAAVRRSSFEPRPENATVNGRVPSDTEIAAFRVASTNWGACRGFAQHITGNFTGTTDEILQWAAYKWGLDEDILRAVASKETWWRQSFVGDNGESFGLMQVKRGVQAGTYPLSQLSTAFNVDYYAAILRYYYDGCGTWLNDVDHGSTYAAGDIWGAVGAWYAGRWHTAAADGYIASVRRNLADRVWRAPGF